MHAYRAHEDGTGRHQVSEPESLTLLTYVLERQNIAVVLTYGRHDNLVKSPEDKAAIPPAHRSRSRRSTLLCTPRSASASVRSPD